MANAKKTAKKVTKRVPKDDGIYWVISERKFLTWNPIELFKNAGSAQMRKNYLEQTTSMSRSYKTSRVVLGE
jgi:hypothetical protein